LPDDINDPRRAPDTLKEEVMRRKPDIWFYLVKKNGSMSEMKLHLVEITVPWGDVEINQEKFERRVDEKYIWKPFISGDVQNDTLKAAREKKMEKNIRALLM
jgi:hypothetical protein